MTIGTANTAATANIIGTWNAFSGSTALGLGSAVAVLSDSSNNTYVRATAVASGAAAAINFTVAAPTTGGSAIARARAGFVVKNGDGSAAKAYIIVPSIYNAESGFFFYNSTTAATGYTGWVAATTPLATATAGSAQIQFITYGSALRWTKAWMEFDLATTPVGTPAVSAVTTTRPTITWAYSDTDGYSQASAVVKLFSSAQYSAAGFSASTSTPLWVGTVVGTAGSVTPGSAVITTNGLVYKPFLQVFKNIDITAIPGAFTSATSPSTASFTLPNAPSATAVWSTALMRVQFTAVGSATPYRIIQFRGTAVGTANDPNYTLLRDSIQTDGTATAYDYFVPRGTSIVYGAYITSGTQIPYLESTVSYSTVTTSTATAWELRSVNSPTTYYNFNLPLTGINFDVYEGQTVFRPLGSTYPVVASGDIGGDDGTMQITATGQTTWDNIKAMLQLQSDLYLVAPFVDSSNKSRRWFIRVTGRSWTESGIPSAQVRIAQVSFVEVQPPATAAE